MKKDRRKTGNTRAPKKKAAAAPSTKQASNVHPLVVGIGASAGGLQAFSAFFKNMPSDSGMSFVLIQHLAPDHKSILAELLGKSTNMAVVEAAHGMALEPNALYVIPPDATLTVNKRVLQISRPAPPRDRRRPIDAFFSSLAEDQGEHAVCIVLSGAGSDGTSGLRAIKEHGGMALAQSEGDSVAIGMPTSAASTGLVDAVLPVEEMPAKLLEYQRHLSEVASHKDSEGTRRDAAAYLAKISGLLRLRMGHDFSKYKQSTIARRVQRRMQVLHIDSMSGYLDRLRNEPYEAELLFREFLISVTQFFRDPPAFAALETVIEAMIRSKHTDDHVRVWVPGCATGEEAYSIAILINEAIERRGEALRVQIFATDIDEPAIAVARHGRYRDLTGVTPARVERWFERDGEDYCVIKRVRSMCIFSNHSVIKDPPFSKLDFISCRNLMIYLDADLQDRVLQTFHYALLPDGVLFLGTAESVTRAQAQFRSIDKRLRLYRREGREIGGAPSPITPTVRLAPPPAAGQSDDRIDRSARQALGKYAPVYVVVDKDDHILRFSGGETGRFLEPSSGAATLNLLGNLRKALRRPLRAALTEMRNSNKGVTLDDLPLDVENQRRRVRVIIEPVPLEQEHGLCVIAFQDTGAMSKEVSSDTSGAPSGVVASLKKELGEARAQYQEAIEDLELANEEMKSASEEYQSVNEELQSSNEELETAKEEMQSVNEELQTVNAELLSKNDIMTRLNSDLRNLLDSTKIATIFLDDQMRIKSFTPGMIDIFPLRDSDRGRPITDIVTSMTYAKDADLIGDAKAVLRSLNVIEREVSAPDRGMSFIMRMRPYLTVDNVIDGVVITFLDITDRVKADEESFMLLGELDHRVKNILALVNAVVGQSWKANPSPDQFKAAVESRIAAIARAHGLATRRGGRGEASLREIVSTELSPYDREGHLTIEGENVVVKSKPAMALTMAVHELTSNAAKYGSLSNARGRISVAWTIVGDVAHRAVKIVWTESDGPPIGQPTHEGFGSKLIARSLVHELDAKVSREFKPSGFRCTIEVPLTAEFGYLARPGGGPR